MKRYCTIKTKQLANSGVQYDRESILHTCVVTTFNDSFNPKCIPTVVQYKQT